jgi:hypothetical protein
MFLLGNWTAVKAAIEYSEKIHETDEFSPDFEGKDDDRCSLLHNHTKTPIILKGFLRALHHCPIINWASQISNVQQPQTLFLSVLNFIQTMEGKT